MKTTTYIKIFFIPSLLLGVFGSIIWSIVFWNNEQMFIHHWTIAVVAIIWTLTGSIILVFKD